jgi:hypothetical protein
LPKLPPLAFDRGSFGFLHLREHLKFLLGFRFFTDPSVSQTQPVMGFAELRTYFNRFLVSANGLLETAPLGMQNPEL